MTSRHSKQIPEELRRWGKRTVNIFMLLDAIKAMILNCVYCRLKCVNPPAVTTGLLRDLGYTQYDIRAFWSRLPLGINKIAIYRTRIGKFDLIFDHRVGAVKETVCRNLTTPVDNIDARRVPSYTSPNTHMLYLQVEGGFGGNVLRINIIRLARIIESYEPGLPERFLVSVREVISGKIDKKYVIDLIYKEIEKWSRTLSLILPYIPRSPQDLSGGIPL
ncbi:MAG: hypothetical protein F7C35_07265 [Desulfurococcales archaeon]|nr:hypothetical protein [Desulfurococcales archaeon]